MGTAGVVFDHIVPTFYRVSRCLLLSLVVNKKTLVSGKYIQHLHNSLHMSRISISAVSWAWLLPRRGRSGRRLDFYGKHHASSSKMSAAWWLPNQVESASKTNFYIRPKPVNHKVPLRGTCNIQLMDQAANLSEVLAWSFSLKSVLRTANIFDVFLRQ